MNCFDDGVAALRSQGLIGEGVRIGLLDTGIHRAGMEHAIAAFRRVSTDGFELLTVAACDSGQHGTAMATSLLSLVPAARLLVAEVIEAGDIAARVLTGLDWLASAGAQIICMPLGLPQPAPAVSQFVFQLARDGIPVVAASGNAGAGIMLAPAACMAAISVGALDATGQVAAYSGSQEVDGQVLPHFAVPAKGNGGTSSSAAQLTGLIAMLLSIPGTDPTRIMGAVESTARPIAQQSHRVRAGAIDPAAALAVLMAAEPVTDSTIRMHPPATGLTRRLSDRLRYADEQTAIHTIVCFETKDELNKALEGLELQRVRRYELVPAALVVGTRRSITSLATASGFLSAETADVDRTQYAFGGIFRPRSIQANNYTAKWRG